MTKKLFLLDGHALIYRAHFAFITRPLVNSKGWNVSAIQGFMRTMWDMMQSEKPTHIAVVFDPKGGTFRHEQFEAYKANREAQPEDISFGIPWVEKIVRAMNVPVVCIPNYEADDVIGTLAKQAEKQGYTSYLVTPDKDYGQLVSEHIFLYKPGRQGNDVEIMGPKEVCEKWGIQRVDQVIDMLGLMGDAVDNIPGLPGIGEKTAAKLLAEFDNVENLLDNADKLKGKQREIVESHGDRAKLSKWLATIDLNAPIEFDEKQFEIEPFNREELIELFKELEFRSLADAILRSPWAGAPESASGKDGAKPKSAKSTAAGSGVQGSLFDAGDDDPIAPAAAGAIHATKNIQNTEHSYHLADTPEKRAALIKKLSAAQAVCYDSETTALEAAQADLVGFSFALKAHEAWYVPVPAEREEAQKIVEEFRPLFENEKIEKIGQNLKYDIIVLKNYGVQLCGPLWDTMLAHYLLEPELRHNMNYMAETYLQYASVKIEELIGKKGAQQGSMRDVPVEQIKDYAAEDADITIQLRDYLAPKLEAGGPALLKLFREVEAPLVQVLADIEFAGVRIDPDFLGEYSSELAVQIAGLEKKILEEAGFTFNVASPKQVGEALFDRMKIPYTGRKMKSGQYSTDEDVLTGLAAEYPICADILAHRGLQKLKSTYVDALPALINPRTGRVHSSFNQALAATGRLSSQNPNLQNIPIRTPEGRKVREAFIPRDEDHLRRLFTDRTAAHRRDQRRRRHAGSLSEGAGHPPVHGRARVRGVARRGEAGTAACRQNGQFQHHLRRRGQQPVQPVGHQAQRGERTDRKLFPPVRRPEKVHGKYRRFCSPERLRGNAARPPPLPARHQQPQRHDALHERTHRHQHTHPGHRGRSHQGGDGQHPPRHDRRRISVEDDPAGARRTRVRRA